jgi:hypothetical protein
VYQDIIGSLEYPDIVPERANVFRIYAADFDLGPAQSDFGSKANRISPREEQPATFGPRSMSFMRLFRKKTEGIQPIATIPAHFHSPS